MDILNSLIEENKSFYEDSEPLFFDIQISSEKEDLSALLVNNKPVVFDKYELQVKELIKSRNPKKNYSEKELLKLTKKYISKDLGIWVFYPWRNTLVHILNEQDFIEVRTNRNLNKITRIEQKELSNKKIGIIGLSVGKSVAISLAMERNFGELRIGDFDILELSNMNRITTEIKNLELHKTIIVKREISEIDPYLKVECFSEGVTSSNIEDFLLKNGKLDILVDECDSLDIKILCRTKAKKFKIPVIMDTSDRGMVDIERFDLEPKRALFHGLLDHLNLEPSNFEGLTDEEKVPYLLPMVGIDTMSKKLKASVLEIKQTISTWPQLASSVILGGAVVCDICRRILLKESVMSGRFFIDVEKITSSNNFKKDDELLANVIEFDSMELSNPIMEKQILSLEILKKENQIYPNINEIRTIVEAGVCAPSVANNQPWKFYYLNGILGVFHDKSRTEKFADYNLMGTYITFGAVIENITLKTHELNKEIQIDLFPNGSPADLIATFTFHSTKTKYTETHHPTKLSKFINLRCTNRKNDLRVKIDQSKLEKLKTSITNIQNAKVFFATKSDQLEKLANIIGVTDRLRFLHPEGHFNFFTKEIRWTLEENETKRDGLDIETIDLSLSDIAGLKIAKDPKVIEYLNHWKGGQGLEKTSRKNVASASAIGVISMPEFNHKNFIEGGRALQKLWITANKHGISFQPLMAPAFFFMQLKHDKNDFLSEEMLVELKKQRFKYLELFPEQKDREDLFIFRLAITSRKPVLSLRREIEKVFSHS